MAAIEWWWNEHTRAVLMCVAGGRDGAFRMQRHCSPYTTHTFYPTFFSCLAVQNCSKVLVKCLADVIRRSSGTRPTEVNMSDVTWWGLRLSATVVFMDPTRVGTIECRSRSYRLSHEI